MCYKHAQLNPFLDIVEVFFTFWWDQEMNELKEKSIASCKLWKEAGKPRSGSIFNEYRCDNSAYRNGLRRKQQLETEIYTNDLHDALLQKQDTAFWHCWKSQFEHGWPNCCTFPVSGISDASEQKTLLHILPRYAPLIQRMALGDKKLNMIV